jgi:adenosylmethionine-8-amino-7-oxononanoate aminotransferase
MEHWNATADIVAIGKSLGAGYAPISATLITDEVLEPIKKGSGLIMSGHTYSGHPLSCATALRVLQVVDEDKLLDNVKTQGEYLRSSLQKLQSKYSSITTVRGKGLLLGLEFDPSKKGLQATLLERCFQNGLLLYPSVGGPEGMDENGILVAPPFITTREQVDELLSKLSMSLKEASA